MAARGKQQGVAVASAAPSSDPPSVARRLWRVVRAVLYMLRRGVPSARKLAMDLHLLLHRGKIAGGKALGALFLASSSSNSHSHGRHGAGFPAYAGGAAGSSSCRALDPSAVHEPARREVEFSCSNTPSSASGGGAGGGGLRLGLLGAAARRRRRSSRSRSRRRQEEEDDSRRGELGYGGYDAQWYGYGGYDAAEVARVFEMLSSDDDSVAGAAALVSASASATPSPAAAQLVQHWAAAAGGSPAQVDRRADEFIRRFYEQLRAQRSAASTPDYYAAAATRSPWPVIA